MKSNGLVEIIGEKQPKERGFFCLQLVVFLSDEIRNGGDNSFDYWHQRHVEASNGNCAFKDLCLKYKKTSEKYKNVPKQLNLLF